MGHCQSEADCDGRVHSIATILQDFNTNLSSETVNARNGTTGSNSDLPNAS
jgi:hypothetical protein